MVSTSDNEADEADAAPGSAATDNEQSAADQSSMVSTSDNEADEADAAPGSAATDNEQSAADQSSIVLSKRERNGRG